MLIYLQTIETPSERARFQEMYLTYRGLMYRVAYQILKKRQDAEDAVLNQTSKAGMLAFDQEITKLTPEESIKVIRRCPHIEAFEELGCSKEERIKLCTKLLMPLDFALLAPYEKVRLEFPKNLAADDVCVMCTKTAE